jgi:hydroxymethylpyrimidine/phosphomethylpyrimidine kinase
VDVLAVGGEVIELRAKRLDLPPMHGTGCTLASLVAGRIASRGGSIVDAVRWAKRVHHAALAHARDVGGAARVITFAVR